MTLNDGIDPPAGRINQDYIQQPSNPRKCTECGKQHDTIVECNRAGKRIEELDQCYHCIMTKTIFRPITEEITFGNE